MPTIQPRHNRDPQAPRTSILRGEGLPSLPAWMEDAACAEIGDLDLFFPNAGDQGKTAKAICAGCDIRIRCLEWAMEQSTTDMYGLYGIWGGLSRRERVALLKLDRHMGRSA